MDAVILSTLFFNTLGIVVISLRMALAYCLPNRHRARRWVLADVDAARRIAGAPAVVLPRADVVELSRAA